MALLIGLRSVPDFWCPFTGDLMLLSFGHDWGWLRVTGLLIPQQSQHLTQALLGLTLLFCADDLAWHLVMQRCCAG